MKTWQIKRGMDVLATLLVATAERGGLQKANPFVWTLKDGQGKIIGTLYLATNMNVVELAEDKSSPTPT